MNRIITPFSLLFAFAVTAQQAHPGLPLHPEAKDGYRAPAVTIPMEGVRGGGGDYFSETFDANLNGWSAITDLGIVDWKWTNSGPGPTTSTYPVPPLNTSTPSGWAIIDDDYDGVSGQSTNASLISPVIDLSAAPANLKVEFDQYFQEFQLDETYVGVSTNGGTSWDEVEINAGVGRDGRPNPELMDVNISPWVAADPSNVQLRFRYVATWDYGWQVDNVAIRDLPNNDMALIRTSNTAFSFDDTEFEFMDYTMYPVSQLAELVPRGTIKNKGFDTQTGVTLNMLVEGPMGTVADVSTPAASYTPGTETELILPGFTPTSDLGTYTLTFTVDQNEDDEIIENNSLSSAVEVTSNVFAHDDGEVQNFQIQAPDNLSEAYEVGNHYLLTSDAYVTAIQVAIHEDTPVGGTVYGAIYYASTSNTEHPDLIELTNSHVITADDLNPIGGTTFITLPVSSPFQLNAFQPYLVMAGSFDGPDNVHFATSGVSDAQVSIIHYPNLATDFQFYITKTPMVRLIISENVGIEESAPANLALASNLPNPFQNETVIPFSLREAAPVIIEVTDLSGRIVHSENLGTKGAGSHRYTLDGGRFAAGSYQYTLTAGNERMSRRMVVAR